MATVSAQPDLSGLWDVAVIGAGPAGAVAAALLARRGWRVLLVEKSAWPRDKACGGCINAAGIALLREADLEGALAGSLPLERMSLCAGRWKTRFALPRGAVVERRDFDARLVEAATAAGACFLPRTRARLLPSAGMNHRVVQLASAGLPLEITARLVLLCDGLAGTAASSEAWAQTQVAPAARLGFALTLPLSASCDLDPATLRMCVGPAGYVGMVRVPSGIHLGAALHPAACNARRGPLPVITDILAHCHSLLPLPPDASFAGTGLLTRRRRTVGCERVLAVGDACGYVEPFTGEGIAWALRAALAAVELLPADAAAIPSDIGEAWCECHASTITRRQRWCRALRHLVRNPRAAEWTVRTADHFPRSTRLVAGWISAH